MIGHDWVQSSTCLNGPHVWQCKKCHEWTRSYNQPRTDCDLIDPDNGDCYDRKPTTCQADLPSLPRALVAVPIKPSVWRDQIRRILEQNPGMMVSELAHRIGKYPLWLHDQLKPDTPERLAFDAEQYEEGVQCCVRANPQFTEDEIRRKLQCTPSPK